MKRLRVILIAIFLVLPVQVLAQNGDVPIETPASETPTPTETAKPIETPASTETPVSSTPLPTAGDSSVTPATPRPSSSATPTQLPSLSPSPSPQPESSLVIEDSNTTAQASNNLVLGIVLAVIATISGVFGYVVYKGKTQKKNDKDDRCGGIRDLLEQKKKELEDFIKNWPEEKIKALAQEKAMDGLKKNEDIEKIIETAESLKAKHDKLKETIELLQKRYDICMLELPSITTPIKNIIFDLGGVVVSSFGEELVEYASGKLGIEKTELRTLIHKYEPDLQTGKIDHVEFWNRILKDKGLNISDDSLNDIWLKPYVDNVFIDQEMVAFIRELKKKYFVGCISNTIEPHASYNKSRRLFDDFELCLLSNEVGIRKPNKEIFELYLQKSGFKPKESIFIDDEEKMLVNAEEMGIHTIQFINKEQIQKALHRLGVD